ncbi:zinc-ribbon domain-containing protein [Acetobacterium paludosum]|uniref:Zinc-ribbon domain-containing protein n=1 Tax=Acetobacterium paludosum TaxID=52693 RepID=A0A923HW84_9FIRM|nr:zinc ribbon domain-containing protein [Acetobacterium paludosum]MBC3889441.1 zinc-ribbon domain-containing protein [Acetobacterium paludosum]
MSNDLLGGLLKGLGNFMPSDDSDTQIFSISNELTALQQQETELYAKIGREACQLHPNEVAYSDFIDELKIVKRKMAELSQKLEKFKAEKAAKDEQSNAYHCSECGQNNPSGTKFCQECGTKLRGNVSLICSNCGTKNRNTAKFCGECGTPL